MKSESNRRDFLTGMALAAGAIVVPTLSSGTATRPSVAFPSAPRERISICSYPFREFIAGSEHKSGNPTIELKDFAAHVAEKFNIHNIEPWSRIFPSTDRKYLERFRSAVEKAHSAVIDIAVDGEHSQYSLDAAERDRAVEFIRATPAGDLALADFCQALLCSNEFVYLD